MIRIDEIYNHTFWPFIQRNVPLTRLFFCDPFGYTRPENLFNFGDDVVERNFLYCHDQEPLYEDIHSDLFSEVRQRNLDLNHRQGPGHAGIIVSEYCSDIVTRVCSQYQWKPYYYFFHGWAALDWFRGYDRTFLNTPWQERSPSRIFFNPNRIIDGRRDHRVLLMYHVLRQDIHHDTWTSFPLVCPDSGRSILDIVQRFTDRYPDIHDVFNKARLPLNLPEEQGHPMHSCWLSRFDLVSDSEIYVVTETIAQGSRLHLTEKIFKPICMKMPFILISTAGSLAYLRRYGFRTFGDIWDESYDQETDDIKRIELVSRLMYDLYNQAPSYRRDALRESQDIIEHNHDHFYHGGFEKILWSEMTDMLEEIRRDFDVPTD